MPLPSKHARDKPVQTRFWPWLEPFSERGNAFRCLALTSAPPKAPPVAVQGGGPTAETLAPEPEPRYPGPDGVGHKNRILLSAH